VRSPRHGNPCPTLPEPPRLRLAYPIKICRLPTMAPPTFQPVSPVDLTADSRRARRSVGFNISDEDLDEKSEFKATTRSIRTNSTASTRSSSGGSQPAVRRARFAEATSVFSPASGPGESQSPFADPPSKMEGPKPSDVGFGYIADNQPVEQTVYIKNDPNGAAGQPLKSALKTPGTASRMLNPLSPTFREEQMLEKEEMKTDIQQAKDLVCSCRHSTIWHQLTISHRKLKLGCEWLKWS
jgi:hypothetical protein